MPQRSNKDLLRLNQILGNRKRISLDELKEGCHMEDYSLLVQCVREWIASGQLKAIRASGTNGKSPALYNRYHIIRADAEVFDYAEELEFRLSPRLDNTYYLKNQERYRKDREQVLAFNDYLKRSQEALCCAVSLNERSFEIWGKEKYLKEGGGAALLRNLKFPIEDLNIYETAEPLSYYSGNKCIPQSVLIIENKDTFFSIRKYMLEWQTKLWGQEIGTLIYGSGKAILKVMTEFETCVEPYICHRDNELLYFGDLDYEGILIYERLHAFMEQRYHIRPFVDAYQKMLEKAAERKCLPQSKSGQNKNITNIFMNEFKEPDQKKMWDILERGQYIPQEIVNLMDFKAGR